jgi:hypothetical protein
MHQPHSGDLFRASTGASSGTDSDPALGHPPGLFPLNRPEVMIAQAQNKFDDQGRRLTDETTRKFIGDLLVALGDWTRRLDAKAEERRRLTTALTDERPGSGRR